MFVAFKFLNTLVHMIVITASVLIRYYIFIASFFFFWNTVDYSVKISYLVTRNHDCSHLWHDRLRQILAMLYGGGRVSKQCPHFGVTEDLTPLTYNVTSKQTALLRCSYCDRTRCSFRKFSNNTYNECSKRASNISVRLVCTWTLSWKFHVFIKRASTCCILSERSSNPAYSNPNLLQMKV